MTRFLSRAAAAAVPPVVVLAGVGLVALEHSAGPVWLVLPVALCLVAGVVPLLGGYVIFERRLRLAVVLTEAWIIIPLMVGAVASGLALWLVINTAPPQGASPRTKESIAAVTGVVTAYVAAILVKPAQEAHGSFSLTKGLLQKHFGEVAQRKGGHSQLYGAVKLENCALMIDGEDKAVNGWGFGALRQRALFIEQSLAEGTRVGVDIPSP